jgi:hypothetical protein
MQEVMVGARIIRVPRGGQVFVFDVKVPQTRPCPENMIRGSFVSADDDEIETARGFLEKSASSCETGPKTLIIAHMRNTGRGFWSARQWAKREGLRVTDPYAVHALSKLRPLRDRLMNFRTFYLVSTITNGKGWSYCENLFGDTRRGVLVHNGVMHQNFLYFVFQL